MPTKPLDEEIIFYVKSLLWPPSRMTQQQVAIEAGCSTGSVSRIAHGYTGAKVPWPNGAIGSLEQALNAGPKQQQ